jgi:hypothetical protein
MSNVAKGVILPTGGVNIVKKIADSFSNGKGIKNQSWTLIYSEYVLKQFVVPNGRNPNQFLLKHYKNWLHFVNFYKIISKPTVSPNEVKEAHQSYKLYAAGYAELYPSHFKPNHHFCLHFLEQILATGNANDTFCFSFERMNKHIKSVRSNGHVEENLNNLRE